MILKRTCRQCGEEKQIEVDAAAVARWQAGQHIQVAMPEVSADDRELLISSFCGKCFDELFAEDEDGLTDDDEGDEEEFEE